MVEIKPARFPSAQSQPVPRRAARRSGCECGRWTGHATAPDTNERPVPSATVKPVPRAAAGQHAMATRESAAARSVLTLTTSLSARVGGSQQREAR